MRVKSTWIGIGALAVLAALDCAGATPTEKKKWVEVGALVFLVVRVSVLAAIVWVGISEFRRWRRNTKDKNDEHDSRHSAG